jgi:hypothetical protein
MKSDICPAQSEAAQGRGIAFPSPEQEAPSLLRRGFLATGAVRLSATPPNVANDDISIRKPCPLPNHSAVRRTVLDVPNDDRSIRADRPDPAGRASHVLGQARCGNGLGCKASACRLGSHHKQHTKKGGGTHSKILQSHFPELVDNRWYQAGIRQRQDGSFGLTGR